MANELHVALAALVVGLAALLIASGQLLQQIFGTADGYRRCQQSVIGPWSRRTRRVWRWSQFRFETRFTTPEIVLFDWRKQSNIIDLNGVSVPLEVSETISAKGELGSDVVSWVLLLRQLAQLQGEWYQRYAPNRCPPTASTAVVAYGTRIGLIYRERSWDLMPMDATRPMASAQLGTVIVLALRLGMRWRNYELENGFMRAEGNSHALISTMMRGHGIVFQYSFNPGMEIHPSFTRRKLILRRSVDMLSCGILPGIEEFKIPPMPLKGRDAAEDAALLSSALHVLGVSRTTTSDIVAEPGFSQRTGPGWKYAWPVHDMIALLVPFLPMRESDNTNISYPLQTDVTRSIFRYRETRRVLRYHATGAVRSKIEFLADEYPDDFECHWDKAIVSGSSSKGSLIESLREIYDWTTDFFRKSSIKYKTLVAAHVEMAYLARSLYLWDDDLEVVARIYIDNLISLEHALGVSKDTAEEAWWMLMLRGLVWRMSVFATNREVVVPSRLYYDQTPVYIM